MADEKDGQGGGNTYIKMTGGIFIKNIEHVEHLHAVPEKEERKEAVAELTTEDEELLLPIFKENRENLRQFFAEVKGATAKQVTSKVNAWGDDRRILKELNMKDLWGVLKKMNIYPHSYSAWSQKIKKK